MSKVTFAGKLVALEHEDGSVEVLREVPAKVSYHCFGCNGIVDGDHAQWLRDEQANGYPFCSAHCLNQPWPLFDPSDGQELQLWSPIALVVDWYHS